MTSKLASMAKIVFSSRIAAARAAPAALAGPLRRILGYNAEDEHEDENHNDEPNNHDHEIEPTETTSSSTTPSYGGVFSALLEGRAAATTALASRTGGPINTPSAKRELRNFQEEYYRRAVSVSDVDNNGSSRPDPIGDPDLSVPVGDDDEYLYLAQ